MPNDENKIILEFPATNVEIELGETITFDNISGFLDSGRVTVDGDSLTEKLSAMDSEIGEKANADDVYDKTYIDNAFTGVNNSLNTKMDKANPTGTGRIAVGSNMLNIGSNSQTFGSDTKALGNNSFATGENNQASVDNQFVFGKYNQYSFGNLVEIVGNGTSESNRSNARTLDWQGNETLAGNLTYNGNKSLTSEISRLDNRITDLPEAMVFKGTLGVGGTIQSLPTASAENEGWTFKCITEGTYAGLELKVGDTVTCFNPPNTSVYEWEKTGSADTDTDTWRNIKVNGVEKLGNGISSGAVDFEDTANVKFEFDADGNKVRAKLDGIYTDSEVDDLLDDKADADNTYTKEQVDDIVYDILPDDTASGSVANFETDLEMPIKSLEVDVNAVQSAGTPTPATPLPISGRSDISVVSCGKNLFNSSIYDGYKQSDGTYRGQANSLLGIKTYLGDFIGKQITFSAFLDLTVSPAPTNAKVGAKINGVDVYGNNINSGNTGYSTLTITPQTENDYINLSFGSGGTNSYTFYNLQLEIGNARTEYTDFVTPITEVINLGGTYYGGHFTQDKDGHRQLVLSYGFNSKLLSEYSTKEDSTDTTKYAFYGFANETPIRNEKQKCNVAPYSFSTTDTTHFYIGNTGNLSIWLPIGTPLTTQIECIYELATPIIIDLPDGEPIITLNGTNNIFADTGDTNVVFKDSVNGYVEKKIASVQALALNT